MVHGEVRTYEACECHHCTDEAQQHDIRDVGLTYNYAYLGTIIALYGDLTRRHTMEPPFRA